MSRDLDLTINAKLTPIEILDYLMYRRWGWPASVAIAAVRNPVPF